MADGEPVPGRRDERCRPAPPAGQGPVLEWYEPTGWDAWKAGLLAMVTTGLVLALAVLLLDVVPWQYVPLLPPLTGSIVVVLRQSDACAAGAEWFAVKARWVRTYELVSFRLREDVGVPVLVMEDRGGRKVRVSLATAQRNRALWDLVYNGLLHSVETGGARAPATTKQTLRLPLHFDGISLDWSSNPDPG